VRGENSFRAPKKTQALQGQRGKHGSCNKESGSLRRLRGDGGRKLKAEKGGGLANRSTLVEERPQRRYASKDKTYAPTRPATSGREAESAQATRD